MKNIIVLSDGTGNGAAKRHKTNVWRLYEALDLHLDNQIAMYDDGVGSKDSLFSKVFGGAFGYGLRRNVIEIYKFLCREYRYNDESEDKIYLFGFSRGAFTVRLVADLVTTVGLCKEWEFPADLDIEANNCYREYRRLYERVLKGGSDTPDIDLGKQHIPQIEFIGVWDTVDAYGFPIEEVADFWHSYIYKFRFANRNLNKKIKRACHALAVDDERKTFHPILWNEQGSKESNRIKQYWFPGVHSDVGGGYPRNSLSLVSLDWMISQVKAEPVETDDDSSETYGDGLVFIDQIIDLYHRQSDWNGPQHDSRSMLGMFYRYRPREIKTLCNDAKNKVNIKLPKIHQSVFERIEGHGHQYYPIGIPAEYEVLTSDGELRTFETEDDIAYRQEKSVDIWDIVKRRANLYVMLIVIATLFILCGFFPYSPGVDECTSLHPIVESSRQWVGGLLPDFTGPWIDGIYCHIWWSGTLLLLLILMYVAEQRFKRIIGEHSIVAWGKLNH